MTDYHPIKILRTIFFLTMIVITTSCSNDSVSNNDSGASDGDAITTELPCTACAENVTLKLLWDENPTGDNIIGYRLYSGNSSSTTNALFKTLLASDIDFSAPSLEVNAGTDLQLKTGDNICFQVVAYNTSGDSEKSPALCGVI